MYYIYIDLTWFGTNNLSSNIKIHFFLQEVKTFIYYLWEESKPQGKLAYLTSLRELIMCWIEKFLMIHFHRSTLGRKIRIVGKGRFDLYGRLEWKIKNLSNSEIERLEGEIKMFLIIYYYPSIVSQRSMV